MRENDGFGMRNTVFGRVFQVGPVSGVSLAVTFQTIAVDMATEVRRKCLF